MKYKQYIHTVLTLLLVLCFFSGALSKLIPFLQHAAFDKAFRISSVTSENYERPAAFQQTITSMQQSGFLIVIGIVQLLSCFFMIIPRTRLVGLLLLLPMTFNIFMLQEVMNNSLIEILKCAVLLLINTILLAYYYKRVSLLWSSIEAGERTCFHAKKNTHRLIFGYLSIRDDKKTHCISFSEFPDFLF